VNGMAVHYPQAVRICQAEMAGSIHGPPLVNSRTTSTLVTIP